ERDGSEVRHQRHEVFRLLFAGIDFVAEPLDCFGRMDLQGLDDACDGKDVVAHACNDVSDIRLRLVDRGQCLQCVHIAPPAPTPAQASRPASVGGSLLIVRVWSKLMASPRRNHRAASMRVSTEVSPSSVRCACRSPNSRTASEYVASVMTTICAASRRYWFCRRSRGSPPTIHAGRIQRRLGFRCVVRATQALRPSHRPMQMNGRVLSVFGPAGFQVRNVDAARKNTRGSRNRMEPGRMLTPTSPAAAAAEGPRWPLGGRKNSP